MSEIDLQKQINALKERVAELETIPYGGVLVDYSDTSTITGWTSYTTKEIYYIRLANIVFVYFTIEGTSDNIATTFTLPFTNSAATERSSIRAVDNGGTAVMSICQVAASTATATCFPLPSGGNWTASGTKGIRGQFFYTVA